MKPPLRLRVPFLVLCVVAAGLVAPALRAWGPEGHSMLNRLALDSLPAEFPDFVRAPASVERIAFLANVPDRWRNADPYLKQSGGAWTDHFLDLEQLTDAGLDPRALPSLRLDFVVAFAAARAAHADKFRPIDPARNKDHTQEWPGFAPWAMAEYFNKLRSAFSYLKAFEDLGGTAEEIANARADIVYAMGVMGHYIGDCAQPLHTTIHHNGWVGPNPNGYSTSTAIHSWMDSGFIVKAGITRAELQPRLKPAEPLALPAPEDGRDPFFVVAMDYVVAQNHQVEPLYRLEKAGLLGNGDRPVTAEGRAFVEGQLLTGAEMLSRTWLTAWKTAPVDSFLRTQLAQRLAPAAPAAVPPPPKKSP